MQRLFAATVADVKKMDDKKQDVIYVSHTQITPGQIRYSSDNTDKKFKKLIASGKAVLDEKTQKYAFKHHDGKSVFSKKKPLDVLKTKDGIFLLDGHHDVMSSIKVGAEMIPIKVKHDFSHMTSAEFLASSEADTYLYLYDTKNQKQPAPKSFVELINDTNRYFAAEVARKYDQVVGGGYISKGLDHPLWIKIGKDVAFIEFKIANALYAGGFVYDPKTMGKPPRDDVIEKARLVLLAANVPNLKLVPVKKLHSELNIDFQNNVLVADAKASAAVLPAPK